MGASKGGGGGRCHVMWSGVTVSVYDCMGDCVSLLRHKLPSA